ncbi:MAG: hypothetical protein M0P13_08080 [Fibrobacteraceae bacterium]|nr:hypothetical protein [Fibrobacteraceae bacterium]
MKFFLVLVAGFSSVVFLSSCGGTKSAQQTMVEDRDMMYKETYKAYMEAEDKYLNILFNLERMPEEDELWVMKRDQMRELEQLRTLMLQSRGELDESIQDWEKYLAEVQKETAKAKAPSKAHFRNNDDKRSSPGELLPGEFAQDSIRKAQNQMRQGQ